ncbi:MAG: antibiotic biosynthesis monooxygenase family protein [Terriglobales bacterium]
MFARVVELNCKPEKIGELRTRLDQEVLPLLRKQKGFVDELVLNSDRETGHVLAISLWNTRDDAERYQREVYGKIAEQLRPVINGEPQVQTFNVDLSTPHKIAAKAA